jgi:hypothetical protein
LRHYGFLGVAWPGLESATLAVDKPLTLRYRVLVHAGDSDDAAVAAHYACYVKPPLAALSQKTGVRRIAHPNAQK